MRQLGAATTVLYLVALLALTFYPFGALSDPGTVDVRLTPFQTIRGALRLGPGSQEFAVLIGNLLAFVPLGLLVPLVSGRRSLLAAVCAGFGLSFAIEAMQWAVSVGVGFTYRSADIDDVIVNTVGAALGYLVFAVLEGFRTWETPAS